MKRANIKAYGQEYSNYVLIENMSDLIDYAHDKLNGVLKESAVELVDRCKAKAKGDVVKHSSSAVVSAVEQSQIVTNRGCLIENAHIYAALFVSMENIIKEGSRIAIRPTNWVSHFSIPTNADVEILINTKYTKSDITAHRWPDGTHWYAKVGHIDVVTDGEQKWSSKLIAMKKAVLFMDGINNENK